MLVAGYLGEAGVWPAMPAFLLGMAAWIYMIYELWMGEGKSACNTASPAVQSAYNTMMWIIIVGWAIYPIGYMCMDGGWLNTALNWSSTNVDLWYNIADAINKIGFGLVVYNIAISESK